MKKNIQGKGYNKGDKYEDKITNILIDKKILPKDYKRAGASDKADVEIILKDGAIKLEIKADRNADYGQKFLNWDKKNKWSWAKDDSVTRMYQVMKIVDNYIDKKFIPIRFTKDKFKITENDKKYDQTKFKKKNIEIPINTLFKYYAQKNCYYLQLENYGYYHLEKDTNSLGTPKFDGLISLRLRGKTIYSTERKQKKNSDGKVITIKTGKPTPWNYSFLGVIKMSKKPTPSHLDIEELDGREFPSFNIKD